MSGLPQYPFAPQRLEVRPGIEMSYLDQGPSDGEWVVMVHGNPSWSYYYRHVVLGLQDRFRCIVPDHIGMGWSDKPDDDDDATPRYRYTLQSRVEDFSTLMSHLFAKDSAARLAAGEGTLEAMPEAWPHGEDKKLTPRKITLIVHDWGGMIGMAWAVKNLQHIARIVVLNTGAFPNPKHLRLPWTLRLGRDSFLGEFLIRGFNAFAWGAATFGVKRKMPRTEKSALLSPYNSWRNRIATLRFVQDIPLTESDHGYDIVRDTAAQLPHLYEVPMQIHWGRHDFVFDDAFLAEWQRRFPNAKTVVYEDAGHYVLEDAHERVVPAVRAFLTNTP